MTLTTSEARTEAEQLLSLNERDRDVEVLAILLQQREDARNVIRELEQADRDFLDYYSRPGESDPIEGEA